MKRLILVFFCVLAFPVMASHIVGGEFEIIYLSGNSYRVNLIVYFDMVHGNPDAKDNNVTARIFRMRDNAVMMNVFLQLVSEQNVSYTQPECSSGEIVTRKLVYSATVQLTPDQFSDEKGYYLAWERCCRNYSIDNIYSEDPSLAGARYAGQTFYLEFPPVVKDGAPFRNSSPRLFPPLNDYACPRRPYYVDFAGVDDDGDSLAYSLVTPLNTKSGDALPPIDNLPRPKPYPTVSWRFPFNFDNIIGGQPDLKISSEGFLTVTPMLPGLFVFAVRCEEFRKGKKIGEVRRDFQMLVLASCPQAQPPKILGKKSTDTDFIYEDNMTVAFSNSVTDENRCIQVQVSDPDASSPDDNFTENISIKAIALNFKKNISGILPTVTQATLSNGSTKTFEICFDECPPFEGGPFQVGIVAYDDACSLPLFDTLRITVYLEPPANAEPYFTTPNVTEMVNEGDQKVWPITAVDDDGDPLIVGVLSDGFSFEDVGMKLELLQQANGLYSAQLVWDSRCDVYDFTKKTNFEIKILLEDQDKCGFSDPDTMIFKLKINLPGNSNPVIGTDLPPDQLQNGVDLQVFESLDFNVFGVDLDDDFITLAATGKGFFLSDYNVSFPPVSGNGNISSHFNWELACEKLNLEAKREFEFTFIVVDNANKCRFYKADSLTIKVNVSPPDNQKPLLQVVNTNPELIFINNEQSLLLGQQISLALIANDGDKKPMDLVSIEMIDASGNVTPSGYVFEEAEGSGSAQTTFTWNPDCSIFENGVYENNYTFRFRTFDNRCFSAKADTVDVNFIIKDVDGSDIAFIPPNIITVNGDSKNDFFAMVREVGGELVSILPKDNCTGRFVSITIYNRWGREVFQSDSKDFRWHPDNEAAGVYFYTLQYSDKEYKGSVSLRN